jgi:protocatechuate 3,4-dioxygenase beta subunit/Flp pilus assembly pilin Flp
MKNRIGDFYCLELSMFSQRRNERHIWGQGLVEYALLLALVALVVGGTAVVAGPQVGDVYSRIMAGMGGDYEAPADGESERVLPEDTLLVSLQNRDGTAIPNVPVYAYTEQGRYAGQRISTDANGEAAFEGLPDGGYKFRIYFQCHNFWSGVIDYPRNWHQELVIAQQSVEIRVVDAAGGPISGALVRAHDADRRYAANAGQTDAEGRATIDLVDGEFTIRVFYRGHDYWSDVFDTTRVQSVVVETDEAPFTVHIVGADGQPVKRQARVYIYADVNGQNRYAGLYANVENGVWETALPQGRFRVRAYYAGHNYWSGSVDVSEQQTAVVNTGERAFFIRAVDAAGAGIPDARVYLFVNNRNRHIGLSGTTDAAGEVVVLLPDGDFVAWVNYRAQEYWSEEFNTPNEQVVTINLGQETFPVTVVDAENGGISGVRVYAFNDEERYTGLTGVTDENGVVTIDLPEGVFRFRANFRRHEYWSSSVDVTALPGAEIATGQAAVTVQVSDAAGDGIADAYVHVMDAAGNYVGVNGRTGADGCVPNPAHAHAFGSCWRTLSRLQKS